MASVVSPAKLETLEILANPDAMRAIRAFESGRMKFLDWADAKAATALRCRLYADWKKRRAKIKLNPPGKPKLTIHRLIRGD